MLTPEQIFALKRWMQQNRIDSLELKALLEEDADNRAAQLEIQLISEENHLIETGCRLARKAVATIRSTILGLEQV